MRFFLIIYYYYYYFTTIDVKGCKGTSRNFKLDDVFAECYRFTSTYPIIHGANSCEESIVPCGFKLMSMWKNVEARWRMQLWHVSGLG